jgi:hypothetical protein
MTRLHAAATAYRPNYQRLQEIKAKYDPGTSSA